MIDIGAIGILMILLALGNLEAVTVVNHHSDDEYVLEHEVLREDALAEAKKLEIYPGPIPGCKPCTNSEITYCSDGSVINDHCCCEGRTNKVFLFVEHTCRVGPEECKVQAGDCAEYTRLRECCCHSYLASAWKYLATGSRADASLTKFLSILTVLTLLLHLLLT
ncbi:PREDICTED: uncharacterized protein LOC106747288 [Dinoponera quadriceps]|uniref:Uncharacterized protein LOC106747288 n=1 Tax=Dinoponera quadriceps TaxID=609295 RepID=A0A6P3XPN9_DINQU|nr:PREDICTED: uncharacterized protein LOC106747288 [Dinoponera quadriceps]XP_014480161.1 PREDICTED: uncharacterized protein LOC106747288 [Dinoponera quadriceps]XP_014480162.1 PREDICTED: uncharacterized protein LOC106747288 [Dinoponera quadriceps]XP_014480164.1 PREDICTED: uncharacterized protein LOC106747288 [Dinoponera quadriceps]XP_014480165.1 PREDICTED: uncharacterized protein LOC106747288 [Dinoponera quadriceps]